MKKTLHVRMSPEDIKALEKEAKATGHTVSSLARFWIKTFLDKLKKQEA